MAYIKRTTLPTDIAARYSVTGCADGEIGNFSKINLIVGPNNSGKSVLLRMLCAQENESVVPKSTSYSEFVKLAQELRAGLDSTLKDSRRRLGSMGYIGATFAPKEAIRRNETIAEEFEIALDEVNKKKASPQVTRGVQVEQAVHRDVELAKKELDELYLQIYGKWEPLKEQIPAKLDWKRIYIPTLRGLRPLHNDQDLYENRTAADLFTTGPVPTIFTGFSLYKEIKNALLGDLAKRRSVRDFENFLSAAFFEDEDVAIIPAIGIDSLVLKVGREKEFPVFSLGDGIQQIIIIMYVVFANRGQNLCIFIEEPETACHPGLQRQLIDALQQESHVQAFMTTHSNHLLDLTLDEDDISIFHVKKNMPDSDNDEILATFEVTPTAPGDLALLESLGARPASIFLANCTIWVEGVTDRQYIRHFLELYKKVNDFPFLEDRHYAFVEYSGANLSHWSFDINDEGDLAANRICARMLVIADRDQNKEEKHQALAAALGDKRYCCLPVVEVENLLTPDVLRGVLLRYKENEENINVFAQDDYQDAHLGLFIEEHVLKDKQASKRLRATATGADVSPYKEKSGTVKAKGDFARHAINEMHDYSELSDHAKALVEKIEAFIRQENR